MIVRSDVEVRLLRSKTDPRKVPSSRATSTKRKILTDKLELVTYPNPSRYKTL